MRSGVLGPIPHGGNLDISSSCQALPATPEAHFPSGSDVSNKQQEADSDVFPVSSTSDAFSSLASLRSTVVVAPEYAEELYGLRSVRFFYAESDSSGGKRPKQDLRRCCTR